MNICLRMRWLLIPKSVPTLNSCRYAATEVETESPGRRRPPKKWRTPFVDQKEEWHSNLSYFALRQTGTSGLVDLLRAEYDFRPSAIKKWFRKKQEEIEIFKQRYIPERHEALGNDLAAAHFLTFRGGAVKFCGNDEWIKEEQRKDLPMNFNSSYRLEAIDTSGMNLYYEGLENLIELKKLKWLSFENSVNCDDWFLDYISGEFRNSLEYLNISNCTKVTERGLTALYRCQHLKLLNVTGIPQSKTFQFACLLLEDVHKDLKVEGVKYIAV